MVRILVLLLLLMTGPAFAAGTFTVSGGQILTPGGANFQPRGVDMYDNIAEMVLGSSAAPLTNIFPGSTILYVYAFSYANPSTYAAFVNAVTAAGIVVVIGNAQNFWADGTSAGNSGGGCGNIFTGSILTTESNWYASLAAYYKTNPYVWFATANEPSYVQGTTGDVCGNGSGTINLPGLATWEQATYNAIRGAGNTAPILLSEPAGGNPGTVGAYATVGTPMTASVFAAMTNVVWDLHYYGFAANYSTNQAVVNANLIGSGASSGQYQGQGILAAQTLTSANGTVPVFIGEYGLATNGQTLDANGTEVVAAVAAAANGSYAVGATAWNWNSTDCCNNLVTNNNTIINGYGTQVQSFVNAPLGTAKILVVGDSVTAGGGTCCNGGPPPGAYRSPLYTDLAAVGLKFLFVGDQTYNGNTPTLPYSQSDYEGIGGYAIYDTPGDSNNLGIMTYINNNNILPDYTPTIVTVQIGYNNIYAACPACLGPAQTFTNLKTMVNQIFAALPAAKVIVTTLPATTGDLGVPTSNPNSSSELGYYNYLILNQLRSAINNANLSVVDSNGAENNAPGGPGQFIGPDGIHPNIAGSAAIAGAFSAGIQAAIGEAIGITTIANQTVGAAFTVSGTISGVTSAPTLQYQANGGAWTALPAGSTVTASSFSFTAPALTANSAATIGVRDANNTSVSATSNSFAVTASSGPTGINTPAQLITYLKSIAGNHVISGQFTENGGAGAANPYNFTPIQTIQGITGQYLGMIGVDATIGGGVQFDNTPATSYAIPHWQAGGLIMMNYFDPNPYTGGNVHDLTAPPNGWTDVVTAGTGSNTNYIANLNALAAELQVYKNAGVVVMLRHMVELNGNWNWFGTGSCCGGGGSGITAAQDIAIWQYAWNYLTNTKGLNNLVWVYATNACGGGTCDTATYPGAGYVDVVGYDIYSDSPASSTTGDYSTMSAYGKPIILAEFGSGSASAGDTSFAETTLISQLQQYAPNVVMWQQWWSGNSGGPGWGMEILTNTGATSSAINNPYVINRGSINCTTCGGGPPSTAITWNPGDTSSSISLSNSNLTATGVTAVVGGSRDTVSYVSGGYCFEVTATTVTSDESIGIANASYVLAGTRTPGGDNNAIAFYPSSGNPQSAFYNGVQLLAAGAAADANGDKITECANLTTSLLWVSTPSMRTSGNTWNNSSSANPATSTGGLSFSGLTCPCFINFGTQDVGTVVTLNATGPFAVSIPSGFAAWQPAASGAHRVQFSILGSNDLHPPDVPDLPFWYETDVNFTGMQQ